MNKKNNQEEKEHVALVRAKNAPISTKFSIEICNFIRNKPIPKARMLLEEVLIKQKAVPFRKYTMDLGHKSGKTGPGRYPMKASKYFIKLINSLEANAADKGLDNKKLLIYHASASKGAGMKHPGRQSNTSFKATNIEMKVKEIEGIKK